MKIGIFGDSWGDYRLEIETRYLGWPKILEKKYNFKVNNHCACGSSLFYSYRKFLKYHNENDFNIFLITQPDRILVDYPEIPKHINAGVIQTELKFNFGLTKTQRSIYSSIDLYYKSWKNKEFCSTTQHLMLEHLRSLNQKTIFIPCFQDSLLNSDQFSLIEFYTHELEALRFNELYPNLKIHDVVDKKVLFDTRVCHMNEPNNAMFAEKIYSAIINNNMNLKFVREDFVIAPDGIESIIAWEDVPKHYIQKSCIQ